GSRIMERPGGGGRTFRPPTASIESCIMARAGPYVCKMPLVTIPRLVNYPCPMRQIAPFCLFVFMFTGCSEAEPPPSPLPPSPPEVTCAPGEEMFRGKCVDPATRYEPQDRVDRDNVSAYGEALTELTLPEPPKSGFRLIAPPRTLSPGEEVEGCL